MAYFVHTVRLTCLGWFIAGLLVQAHPNLQDAMWVELDPHVLRIAVNVSLKEIAVAGAWVPEKFNNTDVAAWSRAAENHRDYLLKHLTLLAGTNQLTGTVLGWTPPARIAEAESTFFQFELQYPISTPPPDEMRFYQDMLKEWPYAAGIAWDVSYIVRTKWSDSDGVTSWLLRSGETAVIPTGWNASMTASGGLPKPDLWRSFRDYLWQGIKHILGGYDHLLFVSALILGGLSFWEMVKVIAAFTLAHTLTLVLAVLGIFRLPSFVVEPAIALSIIFVAVENVFWPEHAKSQVRLAVAFTFGLIHGMGFAGGLLVAMQGLPSISLWIALASFSLGVEIGHQFVVLPLFGLLRLSTRKLGQNSQPLLLRYASGAISCCGVYYLFVAVREQILV